MLSIPRLYVKTIALPDLPMLSAILPDPSEALVWLRGEEGIVGAGVAARFDIEGSHGKEHCSAGSHGKEHCRTGRHTGERRIGGRHTEGCQSRSYDRNHGYNLNYSHKRGSCVPTSIATATPLSPPTASTRPPAHTSASVAAAQLSTVRFREAERWWNTLLEKATISDDVNLPGTGLLAFGSFSFSPASEAGSTLIIPQIVVGKRKNSAWLTIVSADPSRPYHTLCESAHKLLGAVTATSVGASSTATSGYGTAHAQISSELPSGEEWMEQVRRIQASIRRGEAEKVVLSREVDFTAETDLDVRTMISALNHDYPDTWVFAVDGLVGASPEMLASNLMPDGTFPHGDDGDDVLTRVLAGTLPTTTADETGTDEATDEAVGDTTDGTADSLADEAANQPTPGQPNLNQPTPGQREPDLIQREDALLLHSCKDREEHRLAAESAIEALQPLGTLDIHGPFIVRLPNVVHFATDIRAKLHKGTSMFDVIAALHPTAALGGTPRTAALDLISHTELHDRDRYGAPVGWICSGGASQWCVALRCARITSARSARAWVGGGIMADSQPELELAETRAKLRPIMAALSGEKR